MDSAELRRRFEAQLVVADLSLPDDEREKLFLLWSNYQPHREALHNAPLPPEDEPTFIEKPTVGRSQR